MFRQIAKTSIILILVFLFLFSSFSVGAVGLNPHELTATCNGMDRDGDYYLDMPISQHTNSNGLAYWTFLGSESTSSVRIFVYPKKQPFVYSISSKDLIFEFDAKISGFGPNSWTENSETYSVFVTGTKTDDDTVYKQVIATDFLYHSNYTGYDKFIIQCDAVTWSGYTITSIGFYVQVDGNFQGMALSIRDYQVYMTDDAGRITENLEKNTDKIINNQNDNADKIIENQKDNADKIIENQKELQENERDDANSTGNSGIDNVLGAIPSDTDGITNAFRKLANSMMSTDTDCVIKFPAIAIPAIKPYFDKIELLSAQDINMSTYIKMLPEAILLLLQSVLTVALILYCFKELYSWISYALTLKGGSANE